MPALPLRPSCVAFNVPRRTSESCRHSGSQAAIACAVRVIVFDAAEIRKKQSGPSP